MSHGPPKVAVVTDIQKMPGNNKPCRHCGFVFNHPNYCCVPGIDHCPKCGCPVQHPEWTQKPPPHTEKP